MLRLRRSAPIAALAMAITILTGCVSEQTAPTSTASGEVEATPTPAPAAHTGEDFPYTIETVAEGLNVPWDMAVASDGRIFYTERPGDIRVIVAGEVQEQPVLSLRDYVYSRSEAGMLGLALDPQFDANGHLYVYHTYEEAGNVLNRVLRLKVSGNLAEIEDVILEGIPGAPNHNGGRISFGPDGLLYITTGDIYDPLTAQDLNDLGGKILRIDGDGRIPDSNPFPSSPVYSYGHRNPQGLAWDPQTGAMYSAEHGQTGHDEINLIEAGANYGWPHIEGEQSGHDEAGQQLIQPLVHSGSDTWAPSGLTFIDAGPWQGNLLAAGLRGQALVRIILADEETASVQVALYLENEWGRLRYVKQAPDGSVYLMTNNRDGRGRPAAGDDRILRLVPVR